MKILDVTTAATSRNPGLDILRALSVLAVFFVPFPVVRAGWLGVQVFS